MLLSSIVIILCCGFLCVVIAGWSSKSVTVFLLKAALALAILITHSLNGGSAWISLLWIFVLVLNAVLAAISYWTNEAVDETAEKEKIDSKIHCPHCRNTVNPDDCRCLSCGGPLGADI